MLQQDSGPFLDVFGQEMAPFLVFDFNDPKITVAFAGAGDILIHSPLVRADALPSEIHENTVAIHSH